jgi:hypothetical protein
VISSSIAELAIKVPFLIPFTRAMMSGLIGVSALGWVVNQAGDPNGEAVIHVSESDVDVSVGGIVYRIERRRYEPIVCKLPAGFYELSMRRDGRVVFAEPFDLDRGSRVILTAWDPAVTPGPPRPQPEP